VSDLNSKSFLLRERSGCGLEMGTRLEALHGLRVFAALAFATATKIDPAILNGRTYYALAKNSDGGYTCFRVEVGKGVAEMVDGVDPPPDFNNGVCKLLWRSDHDLGALSSEARDMQVYRKAGAGASDCQVQVTFVNNEALAEFSATVSKQSPCSSALELAGPLREFGITSLEHPRACTCVAGATGTIGNGGGCYSGGVLCQEEQGQFVPNLETTPLPGYLTTPPNLAGADGFLESVLNRGRCITVGLRKRRRTTMQLYTGICQWGNAGADQRWKLRKDGFIEDVNQPGKCIDVEGNPGTQNGQKLQLHECEFGWQTSDQLWELRSDGLIESQINRGKCIDADGYPAGWTDAGLQLWDCEDVSKKIRSDQRWMVSQAAGEPEPNSVLVAGASMEDLPTLADGATTTRPYSTTPRRGAHGATCFLDNVLTRGKCVDVRTNGNEVQLQSCEYGIVRTDQRWRLRPDGFIESMQSPGQCIDVVGNPARHKGAPLQLRACEFGWDVTDQQWELRGDGLIESTLTRGKCIDVDGYPGTQDGARLQLWDCEYKKLDSDQRWTCSQESGEALPNAVAALLLDARERADAALPAFAEKFEVETDVEYAPRVASAGHLPRFLSPVPMAAVAAVGGLCALVGCWLCNSQGSALSERVPQYLLVDAGVAGSPDAAGSVAASPKSSTEP